MEYHIDREIRLREETEYRNLYSWYLQEFTKDGKGDSSKPIPWQWSFNFTASTVRYNKRIHLERRDGDEPIRTGSEVISATLQPASSDGFGPHFSMFGTNREIKNFSLSVFRLEDDQESEKCQAWGIVSYTTEIDFHSETEEDTLGVEISLTSRNFDDLRELVRNRSADDLLHMRIGGVSGFYSDWSPSISTSFVKVLTSGTDQEVIKPDACTIDPPRLGTIRDFSLSFTRRVGLNHPEDAGDKATVASTQVAEPSEDAVGKEKYNAMPLDQLVRAHEPFTKLSIPLWILVFLLVAILLFK